MLRHLLPWSTLAPASRLPLLHPSHQMATKASLTSPTSPFLLLTMLALRSSRCQTIGRVGELKPFSCYPFQPMDSIQAILLLQSLEHFIRLAVKPAYLFLSRQVGVGGCLFKLLT